MRRLTLSLLILASASLLSTCDDTTGPEVFSPTTNTEIDGTVTYASVSIPAGVTVTATRDLVMNVVGPVEIAGSLIGNCVAISVNGESDVMITGAVSNACSEDREGDPPALAIVGDGDLTLDGATMSSSGDVDITNDPTLTDADFESVGTVPGPGGTAIAPRLASARQRVCRIQNTTHTADPERAAKGSDGKVGDPGENGRGFILRCGKIEFLGGVIIRAQHGGHGGNGEHEDATAAEATGGNGREGARLRFLASEGISFTGENRIVGAHGGDGGKADAVGLDNPELPKAASATGTAGNGGPAGPIELNPGGGTTTVAEGALSIEVGHGGEGGKATAVGNPGLHADLRAGGAQAGGDANATGGTGGNSLEQVANLGAAEVEGGEGGKGGDATASAGPGGRGDDEDKPGAAGGNGDAQGGPGGRSGIGRGGGGGMAFFFLGSGGDGWNDCETPDLQEGGAGGRGGNASGGDGGGGSGTPAGEPGGVQIGFGEGGGGGSGNPPGDGGDGGTNEINAIGGVEDVSGTSFKPGQEGAACPFGNIRVATTTSGEDAPPSYLLEVDGQAVMLNSTIGANDAIIFPRDVGVLDPLLPVGTYTVELIGVPPNCTIAQANPQTVDVKAGLTTQVDFDVQCVLQVGSIVIDVPTTNIDHLPPGLVVFGLEVTDAKGGLHMGDVAANGTRTFTDIPVGPASVLLNLGSFAAFSVPSLTGTSSIGALASPGGASCEVDGTQPTILKVFLGVLTEYSIPVKCKALGDLIVRTETTGEDPDPDGYTFIVEAIPPLDHRRTQHIGPNASFTFLDLAPAFYTVTLDETTKDENCTVNGDNPRDVQVHASFPGVIPAEDATFVVVCTGSRIGVISVDQPGNAAFHALEPTTFVNVHTVNPQPGESFTGAFPHPGVVGGFFLIVDDGTAVRIDQYDAVGNFVGTVRLPAPVFISTGNAQNACIELDDAYVACTYTVSDQSTGAFNIELLHLADLSITQLGPGFSPSLGRLDGVVYVFFVDAVSLQLHRMNLDGTGVTPLSGLPNGGLFYSYFGLCPNGTNAVAVQEEQGASPSDILTNVVFISVTPGGLTLSAQLTNDNLSLDPACLSLDGGSFVFYSGGPDTDLFRFDLASGTVQQVTFDVNVGYFTPFRWNGR